MKDRQGEGQDRTIYSKPSVREISFFSSNCTKKRLSAGLRPDCWGSSSAPPLPLTAMSVATNLIANGFNHKSQNELADGNIKQEKRDRLTESRNIFVLTICKTIMGPATSPLSCHLLSSRVGSVLRRRGYVSLSNPAGLGNRPACQPDP